MWFAAQLSAFLLHSWDIRFGNSIFNLSSSHSKNSSYARVPMTNTTILGQEHLHLDCISYNVLEWVWVCVCFFPLWIKWSGMESSVINNNDNRIKAMNFQKYSRNSIDLKHFISICWYTIFLYTTMLTVHSWVFKLNIWYNNQISRYCIFKRSHFSEFYRF